MGTLPLMPSYVQPLDNPASRIALDNHITGVDGTWERDAAQTHFEGREFPVTARTDRVVEEWTVGTAWWPETRDLAETFLALLRDAAVADDGRLELHLEPLNGAVVDAVVTTVDVPQELSNGGTDATVTFRRVE